MSQNLFAFIANKVGGGAGGLLVDTTQSLLTTKAFTTKLNITTQSVIKVGAGKLGVFLVNNAGTTSGIWSFNDCATVGAITGSNLIWQIAYNSTSNVEGAIFNFDAFPFTNGLVITVPGGGTPVGSVSFV